MSAKNIILKTINATIANDFIKKNHYSGKVVANSTLHFGVFYEGALHGVMSYGNSTNKKGTINLVQDTKWNGFIELNRMAFDEALPKYSESRAIAISIRLIKKHAPHVQWIISFADGTQCGDGAIYRASGFQLIGIKKNTTLRVNPDTGEQMHTIQAHHLKKLKEFRTWKPLVGFQMRYIYLIDKTLKLNVPILPFTDIDKMGAGMYKGKRILLSERKLQKDEKIV
jgi:hypothetical protein